LIRYLARQFHKLGATPNTITLFSLIFSISAGISLFFAINVNCYFIFVLGTEFHGLFLFLLILFDGVDGALARMTDSITRFGGFLDSVIDRITDFIVIFGYFVAYIRFFYWYPFPLLFWVFLAIIGFFMVSYSRSIAEYWGLKETNIGFAARSERLMILCIFSFILLPPVGMMVAAVISNITAIYRISKYTYKLKKNP